MDCSDIRRNQSPAFLVESERGVAMQTITSSRHWIRRFPARMSLRTLILLVLVVGGGLGWFSLQRQREARRQWVIATIQASGSSVDFDGMGISRIIWFGGSSNPAALPSARSLPMRSMPWDPATV